jgi:hypothetical protein
MNNIGSGAPTRSWNQRPHALTPLSRIAHLSAHGPQHAGAFNMNPLQALPPRVTRCRSGGSLLPAPATSILLRPVHQYGAPWAPSYAPPLLRGCYRAAQRDGGPRAAPLGIVP